MTEKNSTRKINSVSRWMKKTTARSRRTNPSIKDILKKLKFRETVMSRNDAHHRSLKEKYINEQTIENAAIALYEQYKDAGVKWSACVHAVKTDWVSQFQIKWAEKSRLAKEKSNK